MNTKMKALSLALMAVSGLALAGTAAAACPAGPTVAEGGAWTAKSSLGGSLAIITPGLEGTECKLDAAITGSLGSSAAFVRDETPSNEPRYRARFVVDLDDVAGLRSSHPVRIFSANTTSPANGIPELVRINLAGNATGSSKILSFSMACNSPPSNRCSATFPLGAATGETTIEFDLQTGASGKFTYWVNNSDETTPSGSVNIDNSAWGGVDAANLGLGEASPAYRVTYSGSVISFDEFDSRRVSFIGD